MLHIAGPDEVAAPTSIDLSRVLHPSYGFPGRLRLALVPDAATPAESAEGATPEDPHLAEVVRIDDYPGFLAGRTPRRRPGR